MDEYTRKFYLDSGFEPGIECVVPVGSLDQIRPDYVVDDAPRAEVNSDDASLHDRSIARRIVKALDNANSVLSFDSYWDDSADFGFRHYFELHWFLSDDTIELIEVFPRTESNYAHRAVFLRRKPARDLNISLSDLIAGQSITILSRDLCLYNCDKFTSDYFLNKLNIEQRGTPMFLDQVRTKRVLDESERLVPSRPRVNPSKLDTNGVILRFKARLVQSEYERNFIVALYPVDETLAAWEIPTKNSGIVGGKFAERGIKLKSDGSAYKLVDIYRSGSRIEISGSEFEVIDPDDFTKKWLNDHVYIVFGCFYCKSRDQI